MIRLLCGVYFDDAMSSADRVHAQEFELLAKHCVYNSYWPNRTILCLSGL